jgi:carboxylesterase type B
VQESVFQSLLTQAGVTSLAELRALSTSDLQTANALQIGLHSAYGTFTYGPVVDGVFSPDLPTHLLTAGKFSKNVEVMVGHNSDEGPLFTDPAVDDSASYKEYLAGMFPTMPAATLSTIDSTVYPADFSGAQPYTSHLERAILTASESLITCNTYALNIAFKLCTSAYVFDVLPGVHAQDIPYTYYVGDGSDTAVSNTTVAYALQDYITSFAVDGHPRSVVKGVPAIPLYGASAKSVNLGEGGIMVGKAPSANSRCTWWQTAAFK